jgi:hypothetical protein
MVRFSDLLGRGDDDKPSHPATTTPNEPAPNEPVPPAPNEPVPPPPSSTPDDQLERLVAYANSIAAGTPEPPAEADQEPAAGPEHEHGFGERLGPVDDDLLPRRGHR